MTALENSNTSIYLDGHHNLGWGMYIDWIFKYRNPLNSNLVRKNGENNYFSSCTNSEVSSSSTFDEQVDGNSSVIIHHEIFSIS